MFVPGATTAAGSRRELAEGQSRQSGACLNFRAGAEQHPAGEEGVTRGIRGASWDKTARSPPGGDDVRQRDKIDLRPGDADRIEGDALVGQQL